LDAVVGIVLAPISGNVTSGVVILTEQLYEVGVELSDIGTKGFVENITLLDTKVFTLANAFLVMPKGSMRERNVLNYSAEDTSIRMTLEVGITDESDLETARSRWALERADSGYRTGTTASVTDGAKRAPDGECSDSRDRVRSDAAAGAVGYSPWRVMRPSMAGSIPAARA